MLMNSLPSMVMRWKTSRTSSSLCSWVTPGYDHKTGGSSRSLAEVVAMLVKLGAADGQSGSVQRR